MRAELYLFQTKMASPRAARYGFLKVESPTFPHPLTPAPGRGQRGIWGRRRRLRRLLLPQTPFLRKPWPLDFQGNAASTLYKRSKKAFNNSAASFGCSSMSMCPAPGRSSAYTGYPGKRRISGGQYKCVPPAPCSSTSEGRASSPAWKKKKRSAASGIFSSAVGPPEPAAQAK